MSSGHADPEPGPHLVRRQIRHATGSWPDAVHPVLRRVYAARGIDHPDQVRHRLAGLLPPDGLQGLDAALDLLQQAIEGDWRICVIGDFDCDGATGTALAVRGLRRLGARHVGWRVPHRLRHGYGLSPALVADLPEPLPDLLVTVDNGISSLAGVEAAQAAGMRVLITDHHLPGTKLPAAEAIVNPRLAEDAFPSKALAGVGVMFYVLVALRARLREQGGFGGQPEPELADLLDLVALGTVADMVALDGNNRTLVAAGLRRMRAGRGQPGIRALIEMSGRDTRRLSSADLGFALGPRLNAAGRLEDMGLGIECLLTEDPGRALELARRLDAINRERRALQHEMLEQAEAMVGAGIAAVEGAQAAPALCVFDTDWHPGVVGLVAARLKERLFRPVIAFAPGGDDGLLRGSARSIPGFHIRDALADVASRHPGLISRFGGHAMAAGLSLAADRLERFREAFVTVAGQALTPADLQQQILSDGELAPADFSRELAEQIRDGGPWGQAFPEPLFDGVFHVEDWRVVGQNHLKLRLRHLDLEQALPAIEFGGFDGAPPPRRLRLAYHLATDDFGGRRDIQLLVQRRWPV